MSHSKFQISPPF